MLSTVCFQLPRHIVPAHQVTFYADIPVIKWQQTVVWSAQANVNIHGKDIQFSKEYKPASKKCKKMGALPDA